MGSTQGSSFVNVESQRSSFVNVESQGSSFVDVESEQEAETQGLLAASHEAESTTGPRSYGGTGSTISTQAKEFLASTPMAIEGKSLYLGRSPEHPSLGDLRITWEASHLPHHSSTKAVELYSVVAEQHRESRDAVSLRPWVSPATEDFP